MFWVLNVLFVIILDILFYTDPMAWFNDTDFKIYWSDLFVNIVEVTLSTFMIICMLKTTRKTSLHFPSFELH